MLRRALAVLACPECGEAFSEIVPDTETIEAGTLRCRSGHTAEVRAGIPRLVREADRVKVVAFGAAYAVAWSKAGWGNRDEEYLRNLPFRDTTSRHNAEWRVKARSLRTLLDSLDPQEQLRVVDLGCGMGWLAHHLARRGDTVFAVDAVTDDTVGLGAAATYMRLGPPFDLVWGELDRPPFLSGCIDMVICNASLHYAGQLGSTLREISRILRPGGRLLVLNSPVYSLRESAERALDGFRASLRSLGASEEVVASVHHFVRSDLERSLVDAVGPVSEIPFDPGRWFRWSRAAKGLTLGMELASFPILAARKPSGEHFGRTEMSESLSWNHGQGGQHRER